MEWFFLRLPVATGAESSQVWLSSNSVMYARIQTAHSKGTCTIYPRSQTPQPSGFVWLFGFGFVMVVVSVVVEIGFPCAVQVVLTLTL